MLTEMCLRLRCAALNVAAGRKADAQDFSVWEDVFGLCKFERRRGSGSSSEAIPDFDAAFGDIERAPQPALLPVEG